MGLPRFSLFPVERRRNEREPMHQTVRLRFDDGTPWLRGMLSNVSAGGACVSISTPITIPAEFSLVFPPNTVRRCRLVWQAEEKIGVQFSES
jgi:hypothetical protein